ncbi:hypothetical protein ALI144C_52810 [Actinosynnema sp. ALI-1.44]|nr:hypothetical protein ALI144C_52810 [Actinosynnema sp. ALI-1.44]
MVLHRPRLASDAPVERSGFHLPPLLTLAYWTRTDNARANLIADTATTKKPVITLNTLFLIPILRVGLGWADRT